MLPVMLVFIAVVIWAIVDAVKREDIDSRRDLVWIASIFLKRRYVKGEINKAEFGAMDKNLGY